jgi:hypothetical protein
MAAFLSTPFQWSFMVDGELLAVPFAIWGIAFAARGLTCAGTRGSVYLAASGAFAIAALCVKQNFADVFVFTTALAVFRLVGGSTGLGKTLASAGAFALGCVTALAASVAWTAAHRTHLRDVWYALYQFRLDAASHGGPRAVSLDRLTSLGSAAVLSGVAISAVAALAVCWTPNHRDAAVGALVIVLLFDIFSVMAGTNYWLHYLIQPSAPVAILLGLMIARGAPLVPVGLLMAGLALVGLVVAWTAPPQTAEEQVGAAIGRASTDHDDMVTLFGRADVNLAAGLQSPYPYLWALPAKTRDPGYHRLSALLSGPNAPTWVVAWQSLSPHPGPGTLGAAIQSHYRLDARICGRAIYLRNGLDRSTPVAVSRHSATVASRCQSVTRLPAILRSMP